MVLWDEPGNVFLFVGTILFGLLICFNFMSSVIMVRRAGFQAPGTRRVIYFFVLMLPYLGLRFAVLLFALVEQPTQSPHGLVPTIPYLLWANPQNFRQLQPPPEPILLELAWCLCDTKTSSYDLKSQTMLVFIWAFTVESCKISHDQRGVYKLRNKILWVAGLVNVSLFVSLVLLDVFVVDQYQAPRHHSDNAFDKVFRWGTGASALWTAGATVGFGIYGIRLHQLHKALMASSHTYSSGQSPQLFAVATLCMLSFLIQTAAFVADTVPTFENYIGQRSAEFMTVLLVLAECLPSATISCFLYIRTSAELNRCPERSVRLLSVPGSHE